MIVIKTIKIWVKMIIIIMVRNIFFYSDFIYIYIYIEREREREREAVSMYDHDVPTHTLLKKYETQDSALIPSFLPLITLSP